MIQGIQNVSFNGGKEQLIAKTASKVEAKTAAFVNAAIDLTGTKNASEAAENLSKMKIFKDEPDMFKRVASYVESRQPIERSIPANADTIVPENSINYVC